MGKGDGGSILGQIQRWCVAGQDLSTPIPDQAFWHTSPTICGQ